MDNLLKIDEDNFKYLVRKEIPEYVVSLYYGSPRESDKGYIGIKHNKTEKKVFTNKEEAEMLFASWKEAYTSKFYKGELVDLYITFYPIVNYLVICPKCGKNAEIMTWIGMFGFGEEEQEVHSIFCKHCAKSDNFDDIMNNKIGFTTFALMGDEEELEIRLEHNTYIKWEDFLIKGFYKDVVGVKNE